MKSFIRNLLLVSCLTTLTALTPAVGNAGWFKEQVKKAEKIVKTVPKIANPLQMQIDIVRGKKRPDRAIKDFVQGQGKAIATITNQTRSLTNSVDRKFEDVAQQIGGDFGRVVYEIGTGANRLQREFVYTIANAHAAVLQGQDPLLLLTTPLAAAIRDAREKHINSAKPVPAELKKLLAPVVPQYILDRARYVVGELRITLPTIITESRQLFGEDFGVVVDDVIVFAREPNLDDPNDIRWWAHELHHVHQYASWGVDMFAYRYAKNFKRVESEADQSASHVMSYIGQLGQASITPRASFGAMYSVRPVTVNTPVGQTVIYKPVPGGQSIGSGGPPLTDRCVVNGEYVVIDATSRVLSVSQGGMQVGQRVSALNAFQCAFDLLGSQGARYCVQKPTGFVYAGSPIQLGQCMPCSGQQCLQ